MDPEPAPLAEIVLSHHERAVVRLGDVFVKVDVDEARLEREAQATQLAPLAAPAVLWWRSGSPAQLALSALPGTPLGVAGAPSPHPAAAWEAAGAVVRRLHDAPPPPWDAWDHDGFGEFVDQECAWLVDTGTLEPAVVDANRRTADLALRPFDVVFTHGDLQAAHVLVDDDATVTGLIDWADACRGDALFDLAILTVSHGDHLDDVVRGYGMEIDRDVIGGYWALRRLASVRWMVEHGFDPAGDLAALRRAVGA